jgi:hypothetical protein
MARTGMSARAADVARRRWLFIDGDPVRPADCSATDAEKALAWAKIVQVRAYLREIGWPLPVLADSGNGYHLLYRIDLPADDGGLLKGALGSLAKRFDDKDVRIDTSVHDPIRICKLYGTKSGKGSHSPERPHRWTGILEVPEPLADVPRELLEQLAAQGGVVVPAPPSAGNSTGSNRIGTPDVPIAEKVARARAYLAKVPPAVQGCGGDRQTFSACCVLAVDFGLSLDQGLPLLLEYNGRCVPPWPEHELARKLEKAVAKAEANPEKRGWRLRAGRGASAKAGPAEAATPPPEDAEVRTPFVGTVPDYVLGDWEKFKPRPRWRDESGRLMRGRRPAYRGLLALLHREVVRQKRATVCLPDVLCAQVVWGGRPSWPKNWRQRVRGWLLGIARALGGDPALGGDDPPGARGCPPGCPLSDQAGVRHEHYLVTVPEPIVWVSACECRLDYDQGFLGVMDLFRVRPGGEDVFDFSCAQDGGSKLSDERRLMVHRYRKGGRICSVYLPAFVFGSSPRSKLTYEQRNILIALTRELTRSCGSNRQDRAAVVVGGRPGARGGYRIAACPYLEPGKRYVGFNGNGGYARQHLRGRGYHLVGQNGRGWLWRAGFAVPNEEGEGPWEAVRGFLKELRRLCRPFGLVAAGWHHRRRRWLSLDDLIGLTRTPAGRARLSACVLRVYAPEDYLVRWRGVFAERLGFSFIPGDGDEGQPAPGPGAGAAVASAADLDDWMRGVGMTDRRLAGRMGVSRSFVSGYRSGRRPWSPKFQNRVTAAIAAYRADRGEKAPS